MSTFARTLTVQVLEPATDVLVGENLYKDQSLEENGSVALTVGQEIVEVNFATQKFSEDYEFIAYVENLRDAEPTVIQWLPIVRSRNGFSIGIEPLPDTGNYVFYWHVRVRDTALLTISQVDAPESAVTPLTLGATSQTIFLSNPRSTDAYGFAEWVVQNLADGPGQQTEWVQLTSKATGLFVISINPPPDTANYHLRWRIAQ